MYVTYRDRVPLLLVKRSRVSDKGRVDVGRCSVLCTENHEREATGLLLTPVSV